VKLLQREFGRAKVAVETEHQSDTPKVCAVRDQLHQMLLNLLLNAAHASPEGGQVVVRSGVEPDGERVFIEVSDCGPGIPEENLERVFDPFFTTKGPDQGSGLGLMICHRIVEDHGGTIEVESAEGQGATFRVRLPVGSLAGDAPA
jgi:signal transduction histidine kinase